MKLETERLILREWRDTDKKHLIENINNIDIAKYLLVVPYPYTKKDANQWIIHCKKINKEKKKNAYNFAINLNVENKVIGGIGLTKIDEFQGTAELGYWLGTNYHRRGIMTEAVSAVLSFGFFKLNLRRINVCAFSDNVASIGVIKKAGFTEEGTIRKGVRAKSTGDIHDEIRFGMLKEEWEELVKIKAWRQNQLINQNP